MTPARVLTLSHEHDGAVLLRRGTTELFRYVYRPTEPQRESPRPYLHPVRTSSGVEVSAYRPEDHVWHKGIAWSLPNVDGENFWGGPTYTAAAGGYRQSANNGTVRHRRFDLTDVSGDRARLSHTLDWITEHRDIWFTERRDLSVAVHGPDAWILGFATELTNVSGRTITIGSPTTEGRPNAGYGGLFWRGPRSFTGGTVLVPGTAGGDELMGHRAPWLGFVAGHADTAATLVFVDAPDNPEHPVTWFVRSRPYACACPAPFFHTEVPVADGASLRRRYAIVVATGESDVDRAESLAAAGGTIL